MALQFGIDLQPDPRRKRGRGRSEPEGPRINPDQARDALALVKEWNRRLAAGVDPQYSPSIGCAIRAKRPFLRLRCEGCQQIAYLDLRKVVRPEAYPIMAIRDALRCVVGCRGDAPPPVLLGLDGFTDHSGVESERGTG